MEEEKILSDTEETANSSQPEKPKSLLQLQKESWYDKIPLTLKQMDAIVVACWVMLVVAFIVIALDAMDIFNPFGY